MLKTRGSQRSRPKRPVPSYFEQVLGSAVFYILCMSTFNKKKHQCTIPE